MTIPLIAAPRRHSSPGTCPNAVIRRMVQENRHMPKPTRRAVLSGIAAFTGTPSLLGIAGVAAGHGSARAPLAESAVLMTEDGTFVFLGMSRQASIQSATTASRWWCHRLARRSGDTVAMAELEQKAQCDDANLAELLRTDGYGEAEIADFLYHRQHDDRGGPDL